VQVLLEWQRGWAGQEAYNAVMKVAKEHAGGYRPGINYAKATLDEHAREGEKEVGE